MKIILQILAVVLLASCSNGKKTVISAWNNGEPQTVHDFVYGNNTSYDYLYYNEEGRLIAKGRYDDGIQNGEWNWWFDNGKIKDIAFFEDGLYINKRIHFNEEGDTTKLVIIDTPCKGACCQAKMVYFKKNKRVAAFSHNQNGLTDGLAFHFNENGDTISITNFVNNERHGGIIEYADNGAVIVIGQFENELAVGEWIKCDSLGIPIEKLICSSGNADTIINLENEIPEKYIIQKGEPKIHHYNRINAERKKHGSSKVD